MRLSDGTEYTISSDMIVMLERTVLTGRASNALLEPFDWPQLTDSPLLLKVKGEELLHTGSLADAQRVLELALRGLTAGVMQEQMLEAMALLAMVLIRTGQTGGATTLLQFLDEEHKLTPRPSNGYIEWALAQGSHLLELDDQAIAHYLESASAFAQNSDLRRAVQVYAELLLKHYYSLDRREWMTIFHRMDLISNVCTEARSLAQLIQAYDMMISGQPDQGGNLLKSCQEESLPGPFWRLLVTNLRLLTPPFGAGSSDLDTDPPDHSHIDLEVRYMAANIRYICAYMNHASQEELDRCVSQLDSLISLGLHPSFTALTSRMIQQLTAAQRLSKPDRAWRISWFGGLRFESGTVELRLLPWRRKKSLELFLLLLTRPRFSAAKDWVLDILFGELSANNAANQLYVTIHQLRKVLSEQLGIEDAVNLRGGTIHLSEDWIEDADIEQYTTLVRVADQLWLHEKEIAEPLYRRAAEMYAPILPELQDIEWLDAYRDQLLEHQSRILKRLCLWHQSSGKREEALHYCTCWIEADPLREEAYQMLLRILVELGRTAEAHDWYRRWEAHCRQELDTEPLPETRSIIMR